MEPEVKYSEEVIAELKKIKDEWEILQQHPFGVYAPDTNYTKRLKISTQSYASDAKRFINHVLKFTEDHDEIFCIPTNILGSTINREISYAELYKGASKKKKTELIIKANNQLKRDLFEMFEILDNLKQQNII